MKPGRFLFAMWEGGGTGPPELAVASRLALAIAAVLGLAVFPTHAQPRAGADDPAKPAAAKKASTAKATPAAQDPAPALDTTAPEGVEDGVEDGVSARPASIRWCRGRAGWFS